MESITHTSFTMKLGRSTGKPPGIPRLTHTRTHALQYTRTWTGYTVGF